MSSLFESGLSAHYNVAKLLADTKLQGRDGFGSVGPGKSIDLRGWSDHVERIGEAGPLLSRISSPRIAMAMLTRHHDEEKPRIDATQQQQQHDKLHSQTPDRISKTYHRHHRARNATATWAVYDWLHDKLRGKPDPEVGPHLEAILGKELYARGHTIANLDDAYVEYAKSVHSPVTLPSGAVQAVPKSFKFIEHRVDDNGVTRVQAEISYDDEAATLDEQARKTDPRIWMRDFPEIWLSSYRTEIPPDIADRNASPEPHDDTPIGDSWGGYFFERGQTSFDGMPVMGGSVLLHIDFVKDLSKRQVTVEYYLYEALTTSVLCFQSAGGPDVDSDHSDSEAPVYFSRVTPLNGTTDVTNGAGKHLRYSKEVLFSEELNAMALPLWAWSIASGLYKTVST